MADFECLNNIAATTIQWFRSRNHLLLLSIGAYDSYDKFKGHLNV